MPLPSGATNRATVAATVYSTPHREYPTDAWQAVLSSGVYSHLGAQKAEGLSGAYGQVRMLSQIRDQEAAALTRLSPLGYDINLSDDAKIRMLENLAEVDRLNSFMNLVSKQYVANLSGLKLKFKPAEVAAERREFLDEQRKFRGACVADPPLNLN